MKMSAGWLKCQFNWCKMILSSIRRKVAKSMPFVANANGRKKKALLSKCYDKIEDISVYNFAKCCGGDLSYIYKTAPKKRDTQVEIDAFQELVNQYNDALHVDMKDYSTDIRYNILVARVRILESASGLSDYADNVKKVLKNMGIKITESREKNLAVINGKIASYLRELETLKDEISRKQEVSTQLSTLENFSRVITAISTYYKMYLDIRTISLYEYCTYYKHYQAEIKELQKQKSKINGKGKN